MRWASRDVLGLVALAVVLTACGEALVEEVRESATEVDDVQERAHVTPATASDASVPTGPVADDELVRLAETLCTLNEAADTEEDERAYQAALQQLRDAGDRAIPILIAALRDIDGAGFDPVDMLMECGVAAIEPLCAELADCRHPARDQVLQTLGWGLALRWSDRPEGQMAAEALLAHAAEYLGAGVDLSDDEIVADEERVQQAVDALEMLQYAPEAAAHVSDEVLALWERWHTADAAEEVRHAALRVLVEQGSGAARLLPRLLERRHETGVEFEETLQIYLFAERVGSAAPEALEYLMEDLAHDAPPIRAFAIGALRGWGDAAPGFAGRLATLLEDPDPEVQSAAAFTLATLPGGVARAWRELVSVDVITPVVRNDAARALLVDGLAELPAAERVEVALELWDAGHREPSRDVLVTAARASNEAALGRLEAELGRLPDDLRERVDEADRALAEQLPQLWDTPKELREQAAHAWNWPAGQRLVARLVAAREPIPPALAGDALVALTGAWPGLVLPVLGEAASAPLPVHVADAVIRCAAATEGRDPETRRRGAARLLPRLPAARAVVPVLELLDDSDAGTRAAAAESLAAIAAASPRVVPVERVRALLNAPEPRDAAFDTVRGMGARASGLVPDLERLARDGAHGERERAAAALWRLGGDLDVAADTMRAFLAWIAERSSHRLEWCTGAYDDAGEVLVAAPLREGDLDLLLAVRERSRYSLVVPLLARHGAGAAPAVPWLRRVLQGTAEGDCEVDEEMPWGDIDPLRLQVARTLLAIGPAGAAALPELRFVRAFHGDRSGRIGDVIRRLELLR